MDGSLRMRSTILQYFCVPQDPHQKNVSSFIFIFFFVFFFCWIRTTFFLIIFRFQSSRGFNVACGSTSWCSAGFSSNGSAWWWDSTTSTWINGTRGTKQDVTAYSSSCSGSSYSWSCYSHGCCLQLLLSPVLAQHGGMSDLWFNRPNTKRFGVLSHFFSHSTLCLSQPQRVCSSNKMVFFEH